MKLLLGKILDWKRMLIAAGTGTVGGMDVATLPLQTQLKVGEAILEVTQIGKECHNQGCAIKKQVGTCVMPIEGIFARVLSSGQVKVGDRVEILEKGR
jgi:MOSC domain-containing protein YiiM